MTERHAPDLQSVERQLLHKGAYTALYWLLDEGLLPYAAYEQWRYGQLDSLEQAVACERDALLALLQAGERHAKSLKLVDHPEHYYDWRAERAGRELPLSPHGELARLLAQRWIRPQDAPQLDLFMDSGTASAENDLIDQLADRRWPAAEVAYGRLCEQAPDHPRLGAFETLVLYGKHIAAQADIAQDTVAQDTVADELAGLEEDIAPLAQELLRDRARDYLAPAWQRLARALATRAFDPGQPQLHASHAWSRIPDWQQVIASIEATMEYPGHFSLLSRLAEALYGSRQREAALLLWGRLFEVDAECAEALIERQAFDALRQHWRAFADSDDEHPLPHFGGWLLLREPGLLHHLEHCRYPLPEGDAFTAVRGLLAARAQGGDEVAARAALQQVAPGLLRAYLQDPRATARSL